MGCVQYTIAMNASERQKLNPPTSSDYDDEQLQAFAKNALLAVSSFLSATWSGVLGVCGMGSSEGGRTAAEVSMADRTRRWRLPEFAGLTVAMVLINLVLACFSENEQFIPEVRQTAERRGRTERETASCRLIVI